MKLTVEHVIEHFNRPILLNEHGCWLWFGNTDIRGYARYAGKLVHGMVWRMAGFECIGFDIELCHTCPNHNCINPDHFYLGTHKQNMNDGNRKLMGPKGRLTQEEIDRIILLLDNKVLQVDIAKEFNVSQQWLSKFKRGGFKYAKPFQPSE